MQDAYEITLLTGGPGKLQISLHSLTDSACVFGRNFATTNCIILLPDRMQLKSSLVLTEDEVGELDKFSCFVSCISPGGSTSDEVSSRTQKTKFAFTNLRNVEPLVDKGGIFTAAIGSHMLPSSQTKPLTKTCVRILSVFEHRCFCTTGEVWWDDLDSNAEMRHRVVDHRTDLFGKLLGLRRLGQLKHVVRRSTSRLSRCAQFSKAGDGWKMDECGQFMHWRKGTTTLTNGLSAAGRV